MGAAKKYLPADHSDKGTVAENIFTVLCFIAAYDGSAAGHKFAEIVACGAQNPQFRRIEARIVLGHGHAPGTDIAGNVNFSLGHGIGTTVADITMYNDFGPGIQPSNIIGCRSEDLDRSIWKPHRPHPLPGIACYSYINCIIAGPPQPSANTVLAVGLYLQIAVALGHRRL